jgi:hypothetical protein
MYSYSKSNGNRTHQIKVCADFVFYRQAGGPPNNPANLIAVTNGVESIVGGHAYQYWDTQNDGRAIAQLPNSECHNCLPSPGQTYDCLNGACISSSAYRTNGVYSTLELCQASCGGGGGGGNICPPGMVCLPAGEFSQIEGLAAALKNSACL